MTSSIRRLAVLVLAVAAISDVCAQNEVDRKADPRLDKKVSIEVAHSELEDVAKQLTEQSGVTIKAGTGERDWKVRERKVTIHAKDVPLRTVLNEAALLLGFQLTKSGKEGEWAYTFWQDRKARLLEDEMVSSEREAKAERIRKMREASLETAEKALKMTPEQAAKEGKSRPWLAFLGGTKSGRAAALLLSYLNKHCPTERALMMRGLESSLMVDDLPPEIQRAVMEAAKAKLFGFGQQPDGEGERLPYMITIETPDDDAEAGFIGASVDFFVRSPSAGEGDSGGSHMGMLPILDADSAAGKIIGKAAIQLEEGVPEDQVMDQLETEVEKPGFMADVLGYESPTEKNPPTDPELTREIEVKKVDGPEDGFNPESHPQGIGRIMAEIARATGWAVEYESFSRPNNLMKAVAPGRQPLYKVLIGLEKGGYTWKKGEGTLRVRPVDWALRRSYEIPESFVADCMALIEKHGVFTIDDYAWIASSLSDDQIIRTLWDERLLASLIYHDMFDKKNPDFREMLRFYGSMSPSQKAAMATEAGLPFSQLTQAQWDAVSASVSEKLAGVSIADGVLRMTADQESGNAYYLEGQLWLQGENDPHPFGTMIYLHDKQTIKEIIAEYEKLKEEESKSQEGVLDE